MTHNLVGKEEGVLVIPMPGNKVPAHHSSLHPSEKELLEQHSGVFRTKIPLPFINF
jgi:hypothetical protein